MDRIHVVPTEVTQHFAHTSPAPKRKLFLLHCAFLRFFPTYTCRRGVKIRVRGKGVGIVLLVWTTALRRNAIFALCMRCKPADLAEYCVLIATVYAKSRYRMNEKTSPSVDMMLSVLGNGNAATEGPITAWNSAYTLDQQRKAEGKGK